MARVQAIVGLGNPGPEYASTRHNAGALWVGWLCARHGLTLRVEKKFQALYARLPSPFSTHLIIPQTWMNRSGMAVAPFLQYFKLTHTEMLVAHDELDLPGGTVRLKEDGGHGGHNGLRDIEKAIGGHRNYARLRIGIGHPGHREKVHGHVLGPLSKGEWATMEQVFSELDIWLPDILDGRWDAAMNHLHSLHI